MSKSHFPNIFLDQSKDPIWMIDLDYRLIYANKTYLELVKNITGKEQQINETAFIEDFDKNYTIKWRQYYTRALSGEAFEIEEHYSLPDTNEIYYGQITFEPLLGDDEKLFAIACQSRNISKIVKHKTEVNQLIDASLDVFCTINEQGRFVYISGAALDIWGYTPEELLGKPYKDLIMPEDLHETQQKLVHITEGQTVTAFKNRYIKKNGDIAYNLWSVKWDPESRLFYSSARDGKEVIKQEEKIHQSEQRFKALVQEGSDLIAILDVHGNYKYASPTNSSIVGISQEEFLSKNIIDLIHPDDKEKILSCLKKIKVKKKLVLDTFRIQNHKKEWRWIETVFTNMLDNPAVEGIVANSRDITDEKILIELNQQTSELGKIGSWEAGFLSDDIYWSEEVHKLHETDPENFTPSVSKAIDFYRQDFKVFVETTIQKCIETGEPFDFEAVILTTTKKELWVRVIGAAEFIDGKCKRIYGSTQNINDKKEAENRLNSLADNLPGVVFQYLIFPDGSDNFKYINKGSQEVWGFPAEDLIKNSRLIWEGIIAGGEIKKVRKSLALSIKSKSKWTTRFKYIMPNGEVRIHLCNGTPIFLADGTILFNAVILDVTQETKDEKLLELVTKIARIGSWELDLVNQTGDNMYWSPMLFEILEIDDNYNPTLTGGIEFHIGESRERIKNALEHLINDGIEFDEEILLRTAQGKKRWARAIGKCDEVHNKRTRIYGSYQDITERKKSELENKFKANLLSTVGQAAVATNLKGEVTYWNRAAESIYGWKMEEILGKNILELTIPDTNSEQATVIMEKLKKGQTWSGEFVVQRKDGSSFPALITNSPTYDENNRLSGMIGISSDITQKVRYEKLLEKHAQELERSNLALKKIAWTQSHVVRAPIARILAVINLLEEQPESFDEISFWLKQLKISTHEMDAIVKKIITETHSLDQE